MGSSTHDNLHVKTANMRQTGKQNIVMRELCKAKPISIEADLPLNLHR